MPLQLLRSWGHKNDNSWPFPLWLLQSPLKYIVALISTKALGLSKSQVLLLHLSAMIALPARLYHISTRFAIYLPHVLEWWSITIIFCPECLILAPKKIIMVLILILVLIFLSVTLFYPLAHLCMDFCCIPLSFIKLRVIPHQINLQPSPMGYDVLEQSEVSHNSNGICNVESAFENL